MNKEEFTSRVTDVYADALVEVSGEDCNFKITVISTGFDGQNLLQRQKAIMALFKDELNSGALHALSITAKTPDEYKPEPATDSPVQIQL